MTHPNTRQFLNEILSQEGFEHYIEEHADGTPFVVKYRDETFLFYAHDDVVLVDIWDYQWYSVNSFEVEKVNALQIAINEINKKSAAKLICSAGDDDNIIVSSKRMIAITRSYTKPAEYLKMELDSMLSLHYELYLELKKDDKIEKEANDD